MKPDTAITSNCQRREFLRACLRGGGLIAIGSIATLLGLRANRGVCPRNHPCGGCPLLASCDLPQSKTTWKPEPETHSDHGPRGF